MATDVSEDALQWTSLLTCFVLAMVDGFEKQDRFVASCDVYSKPTDGRQAETNGDNNMGQGLSTSEKWSECWF